MGPSAAPEVESLDESLAMDVDYLLGNFSTIFVPLSYATFLGLLCDSVSSRFRLAYLYNISDFRDGPSTEFHDSPESCCDFPHTDARQFATSNSLL